VVGAGTTESTEDTEFLAWWGQRIGGFNPHEVYDSA
jgi:hypothetical protein